MWKRRFEAQRGAAAVEYMVVALVMTVALFGNFDGGESVAIRLAEAVTGYFGALTYIISLP